MHERYSKPNYGYTVEAQLLLIPENGMFSTVKHEGERVLTNSEIDIKAFKDIPLKMTPKYAEELVK